MTWETRIASAFTFFVMLLMSIPLATQAGSVTDPIGIDRIAIKKNLLTGKTDWGWAIVHRMNYYQIDLETGTAQVPILAVMTKGVHEAIEDRAADIAERMSLAWDLMKTPGMCNGTEVYTDRRNDFFRQSPSPSRPYYNQPSIYVRMNRIRADLRILTIYPEDARAFGGSNLSANRLANYLGAQIAAHCTLFNNLSVDIGDYENLRIDETKSGKIYKEIFLRTKEYMTELKQDQMSPKHLGDSLARIERNQRVRLHLMSHRIPADWQ
jgi:hypothetical protein